MNNGSIRLLLVEDNADDALILEESVSEINSGEIYGCHFAVDRVESIAAAKVWLEDNNPDVVLLDLSLPDSSGIETVYKFEPYVAETPIIILTGLTDSTAAVKSIRQGIQDYLVKGTITPDSLFRSVVYAVERHKMVTVIQSLAMVDELTGLYNRRGFMKLARHNMNLAKRKGFNVSLLFADLDNMKKINDTWGHKEGDRALQMTAQVLRKSFRESDIAARIGGDEFVVMSSGSSLCSDEVIRARFEKNIEEVRKSEPHEFDFSVSFGVINPDAGDNVHIEQLLEMADGRMYDEKVRKKGVSR
jgi:diguanylate cyclase (GGDEF)-like protein